MNVQLNVSLVRQTFSWMLSLFVRVVTMKFIIRQCYILHNVLSEKSFLKMHDEPIITNIQNYIMLSTLVSAFLMTMNWLKQLILLYIHSILHSVNKGMYKYGMCISQVSFINI